MTTVSPLLLLGALWERLHVELRQVPAVLVPAEVPLEVHIIIIIVIIIRSQQD